MFRPFVFYDFRGEESGSPSIRNKPEAKLVVNLIATLCASYPKSNVRSSFICLLRFYSCIFLLRLLRLLKFGGTIGIITPYKGQTYEIEGELRRVFGQEALKYVEVKTVDGFQGREKDIIIFSCVRCVEGRGVGFLDDTRRMNVALTRAKYGLFVVGDSRTLSKDDNWRALVQDAKNRDLVMRGVDVTFPSRATGDNFRRMADAGQTDLPKGREVTKILVPGQQQKRKETPEPAPEPQHKRPKPEAPKVAQNKGMKPSSELF